MLWASRDEMARWPRQENAPAAPESFRWNETVRGRFSERHGSSALGDARGRG
jgi:hypothetical protein